MGNYIQFSLWIQPKIESSDLDSTLGHYVMQREHLIAFVHSREFVSSVEVREGRKYTDVSFFLRCKFYDLPEDYSVFDKRINSEKNNSFLDSA